MAPPGRNPNGGIPPKPSRPFTEYHIFFQLERNYILQTSDNASHIDTTVDFTDLDPHAATRPLKYRSLVLPAQWHVKGSRPKRRSQRKVHGKISFVELTKLISQRWRQADQATKNYCRDLAERELKRYREAMKVYTEQYGEGGIRSSAVIKKKQNEVEDNSKVGQRKKKNPDSDGDDLVQDHVRNEAGMAATQPRANQGPSLPYTDNFAMHYLHQQVQQFKQQQRILDYQDQLLKMSLHLHHQRSTVEVTSQVQPVSRDLSQILMPQEQVNRTQWRMMDPYHYELNEHGDNLHRIMTMSTVANQGPLPPRLESREYDSFLPNGYGRNANGITAPTNCGYGTTIQLPRPCPSQNQLVCPEIGASGRNNPNDTTDETSTTSRSDGSAGSPSTSWTPVCPLPLARSPEPRPHPSGTVECRGPPVDGTESPQSPHRDLPCGTNRARPTVADRGRSDEESSPSRRGREGVVLPVHRILASLKRSAALETRSFGMLLSER